jgi:hypothetical protein
MDVDCVGVLKLSLTVDAGLDTFGASDCKGSFHFVDVLKTEEAIGEACASGINELLLFLGENILFKPKSGVKLLAVGVFVPEPEINVSVLDPECDEEGVIILSVF